MESDKLTTSNDMMDVDPTTTSNQGNSSNTNGSGCTLKRCSSAPMIIDIKDLHKANTSPCPSPSPTPINNREREHAPTMGLFVPARARRFSASFSPHSAQTQTIPRLTPRVNQLRQEEAVDVTNIREVAHEREIHNTITMSQSWEDLTLTNNTGVDNINVRMLPLNITLPTPSSSSPLLCSSPSPTRGPAAAIMQRAGGCCFSPISTAWRSMSPSPTRRQSFTTRRSLSPTIAMRPSALGAPVKRKFDLDDELNTPSKRLHSSSGGNQYQLSTVSNSVVTSTTVKTLSNGGGNNNNNNNTTTSGATSLLITDDDDTTTTRPSLLSGGRDSVGLLTTRTDNDVAAGTVTKLNASSSLLSTSSNYFDKVNHQQLDVLSDSCSPPTSTSTINNNKVDNTDNGDNAVSKVNQQ